MLFKTIDTVLKSFQRNVEHLDQLAEEHTRKASEAAFKAKEYQDMGRAHHDHADRAQRISKKITDLIT